LEKARKLRDVPHIHTKRERPASCTATRPTTGREELYEKLKLIEMRLKKIFGGAAVRRRKGHRKNL